MNELNRDDDNDSGDDAEDTWRESGDEDAGEPSRPRAGRFDHERWIRRLDSVLQRHEFANARAFRRFLESDEHRREAEEFDGLLTIEEESQELAYLAMEAGDDDTAENYVRDAVALDPDCVDARVLLSFFVTDDLDERIWLLERAVDCGRWRFESAKTGDHRDHYLGRIEAKPLQRALHSLAETLIEAGEEDEAEKLFEESSKLPSDLGDDDAKYLFVVFLLRVGKVDKVRLAIEHLPDQDVARDWCSILERFVAGEREEAEQMLSEVRPRNFHVESYLSGEQTPPPETSRETLSDEQDDALWIASMLRPAWEAHPEALEWLRNHQ